MTSNKPYLIRAIYEWICDNDCTPYLYVNTACEELILPESLAEESPLLLNISPAASVNLIIDNDTITFTARFSGQVFDIYLPLYSIVAIAAKETGQGLSFPDELPEKSQPKIDNKESTAKIKLESPKKPKTSNKSNTGQNGLKIVK